MTAPQEQADTSSEKTAEEIREQRMKNIRPYQFGKGKSGNPGGRPVGLKYFTDAYADLLSTDIPAAIMESDDRGLDVIKIALSRMVHRGAKVIDFVALAVIQRAMCGHVDAVKELTDRLDGKVVQHIQQKIETGPPLDTAEYELDNLTADELEQLIALYAKATKGKPPRKLGGDDEKET